MAQEVGEGVGRGQILL
nr:hypothetical protein [Acidovorax sp. Root219]